MQFQDALLQWVSLGNQKGCLPAPSQNSKGEFVSMWQRYIAPITSAHPLGQVRERTTRAASRAASERAACESLSTRRNKPFPQKAEEAQLPGEQAPKQTTCILLHQDRLSKRNSVCVGGVFKHLLTTQIPSRTTKSKWYSSWISQLTTAAFRH